MNNPPILLLTAESFEALAAVDPSAPAPSPPWAASSAPALAPLSAAELHLQQICLGITTIRLQAFLIKASDFQTHTPLFAEYYRHFPFWMLVFCQKLHSKIKRGSPLTGVSCNKHTIVLSLPRYPGFLINCGAWGDGCLQKRGGKGEEEGAGRNDSTIKRSPAAWGPWHARRCMAVGAVQEALGSLPAPFQLRDQVSVGKRCSL